MIFHHETNIPQHKVKRSEFISVLYRWKDSLKRYCFCNLISNLSFFKNEAFNFIVEVT